MAVPGTIGGNFHLKAHAGNDTVMVVGGVFEHGGLRRRPGRDTLSTDATTFTRATDPLGPRIGAPPVRGAFHGSVLGRATAGDWSFPCVLAAIPAPIAADDAAPLGLAVTRAWPLVSR